MSDYCLRKNGTVCVNPERCHALLVDVLDHCEDQHVCDGANAALEALKALHGGSDVAENLKKEALLSCEFWALLVRRIADAGTDGLAICTTIREHIRAIGTLKGPAATVPAATVLGRAVTRQQLADTFTLNQYYPTAEDALAHLDKLERKTLRHFQRAWGDFDLGRFVMWST
ncbi:MAG TPA: hypothetical protein VF111_08805, partial [Thermoanaerobaculia bacterium]